MQQRLAGAEDGEPDAETIRWFLRDRRFDVDETVSKLEKMMQWRSDFRWKPAVWRETSVGRGRPFSVASAAASWRQAGTLQTITD